MAALQRDREQAIANVNAYDGAIQECQFWLELLKNAEQEEEAMIHFPKWKYHKDKDAVVVNSAEEEKALGPGWADSPAAFQAKAEDVRGGPGLAGTEVEERQVAAEAPSEEEAEPAEKPKDKGKKKPK